MLELLINEPIFIGFKADAGLQRHLESMSTTDRQYIADDDSGFLRVCRIGEEVYVGKLVHGSLTTDQVDNIRRNVVSIMQKLRPTVRCTEILKIFPCRVTDKSVLEPRLGIPALV